MANTLADRLLGNPVAGVRLFPGSSWQARVRRVVWLLEWRGRRAGCPRPVWQTPSAWLRATLQEESVQQAPLGRLALMAEWSAYAPDLAPPWGVADVQRVCSRVLDEWTFAPPAKAGGRHPPAEAGDQARCS